jgi:L-ornithine Nalpha-acyltransferase
MSELSLKHYRSLQSVDPIVAGRYEVKLASSAREILLAQKLRYQVMYQEKGGRPDLVKAKMKADIDEWDASAQHIIVLDRKGKTLKVVGTLRLVSNLTLKEGQRFYTEAAFDLSKLRNHYPCMLELGRFCIDQTGRNGAILLLIWKFAMQFIVTNRIDVMLGCASFPGTDIQSHREVFTYLYNNNLAPEALMPEPIKDYVEIENILINDVDFDVAARDVPTLLRGYLKLGARTSSAAIIDPVFNTTFLCIYVDASSMISKNTTLVTAKRANPQVSISA